MKKCAIKDKRNVIKIPKDDMQNNLYIFLLLEEIFKNNRMTNETIDKIENTTEKIRKPSPSFGIWENKKRGAIILAY